MKLARRHYPLALLLIGLLVFWQTRITPSTIQSDPVATLRMAINLAHHGVLSTSEQAPYIPSMYREPLPALLSAATTRLIDAFAGRAEMDAYFSGDRAKWLKHQNLFWMLLLCIAVYLVCIALTDSVVVALVSVLLAQAVFFYPAMKVCGVDALCTEIPASALLLIGSALFAFGVTLGRRWMVALCGIIFGLLALTKASALYVTAGVVLATVGYVLWRRRGDAGQVVSQAALLAIGCLVVVSPWIVRNYTIFGSTSISDRGGLALYIRALKDQMTSDEFVGAFYVWAPRPVRALVGRVTGYTLTDTQAGGVLQRLNRDSTSGFLDVDREAERLGQPQDAVSFYYRGRAEWSRLRRLARASGEPFPWLTADRELVRKSLTYFAEHPGRHLAATLPFLWRGAFFVLPPLLFVMALALRRSNDELLLLCVPSFGLIAFHALLTNFEQRYGVPVAAVAFPGLVCALRILWAHGTPVGEQSR